VKPRQVKGQVAKGHRRLVRLRERAAREGLADHPLLKQALDDLAESLEDLSVALEESSSANEKLAEANLAAAQHARHFEELFRLAPDAYLVTDGQGVVREVNAAAEKRLGRARRHLIGKPMVTLVTPADGDVFLACLAGLRDRRVPLDDQLLRFGSDPGWDASISALPRPGAEGLEISWMLRDITERRRSERALRASDARNRAAMDMAFDGILGTDPAGVIRSSNTALRQMFGYRAGELEGGAVDVLGLSPGELAAIAQGSVHESIGIRSDGSRFPIQLSVSETRHGDAPIVSAVRDLSVQRGLESQLRAATAATAMAEERERQRLAADLHDDVGQLLSLAGMKLGMLRGAAGDAAARLREEVADLVTRAHQRTESLMFQLSPPVLRDMGLTAAVEWLAEDIEKSYGLRVHVEHDGEPPLDEATSVTVFRSLRELLINAARHARTNAASVRLVRDGNRLGAAVEDRGIGFDFASHAAGFGLASVRERVEALGGRFEIDSEVGGGTRANIVVALANSPRTRSE
jgi:PAS domain S-box-containing protein